MNGATRRHNVLRDTLAGLLRSAAIPHRLEVVATGRYRPADVLLLGWNAGEDVAVDLVVSHPLGASCYPLVPGAGPRHLKAKEVSKIRKHQASCRAVRWGCHPVAFSPWGGVGPLALSLLHELGRRSAPDGSTWLRKERMAELRQIISLSLMREVARQLSARCLVSDQVEAQALIPAYTGEAFSSL
jgi:hypothetical protein